MNFLIGYLGAISVAPQNGWFKSNSDCSWARVRKCLLVRIGAELVQILFQTRSQPTRASGREWRRSAPSSTEKKTKKLQTWWERSLSQARFVTQIYFSVIIKLSNFLERFAVRGLRRDLRRTVQLRDGDVRCSHLVQVGIQDRGFCLISWLRWLAQVPKLFTDHLSSLNKPSRSVTCPSSETSRLAIALC